jgi:nucleotide-binding universal stress UspA family protein
MQMRFLIAIDSSTQAEKVLRFGAQFAQPPGEAHTILTVVEREKDIPQAEGNLASALEILESEGIRAQTKIRVGHPAEEIVREAEESDQDIVMVGEGRHRKLATRFCLGSTSIRVAEHAPCAVIIVKGKADPIRQILLCDSGANNSLGLSRAVSNLVSMLERKEQITVLHVMSQIGAWPGVSGEQLRASAEELIKEHAREGEFLNQDLEILEQQGIYSKIKVRHGLVVDEILSEAQAGGYELIVIGAHSSDGWQRLLLEDLSRKLVLQSTIPVYVVRKIQNKVGSNE